MNSTARKRLIAVVVLCAAGGALAFIAFGNIGSNLVYYWSPKEMLSQGERAFGPTIRLGGVVQPGSVEWSSGHTSVNFRIAENREPDSPSVAVSCSQTPPQMFREGIGVVVEGTFDKSQVFKTSRLMINHSNEYRPPKPGDKPADWKGSVSESSSASTTSPTPAQRAQ